jgi:hypothetical protein
VIRAVVVVVAVGGCATTLESTSARTLAPGTYEVSGALGATAAYLPGGDSSGPLPLVAIGVRRGITDGIDVGAKLSPTGAELDVKVQLLREDRGWSIAVAPGAGYMFPVLASVVTAEVPVLVGYTFAGGHELVLGSSATALIGPYDRASFDVMFGTSLGFAWRMSSRWRVMPEVTATRTVRDPVWGAGGGIALLRSI